MQNAVRLKPRPSTVTYTRIVPRSLKTMPAKAKVSPAIVADSPTVSKGSQQPSPHSQQLNHPDINPPPSSPPQVSTQAPPQPDSLFAEGIQSVREAASHYEAAGVTPGTNQRQMLQDNTQGAALNVPDSDSIERLSKVQDMVKKFRRMKHRKYNTKSKLFSAEVTAGGDVLLCCSRGEIRAPLSHCVAYGMGYNQQYTQRNNNTGERVIEQRIVERSSPYRVVGCIKYALPFPLTNRELVFVSDYHRLSDEEAIICVTSCEHAECPRTADFVRMSVTRAFTMKRISSTQTSLEVVSNVELGGFIPKAASDIITVREGVEVPVNAMRFFAAIRAPDACDVGGSKELGKIFAFDVRPLRRKDADLRSMIRQRIELVAVLRSAHAEYPFMEEMLYHIMRSKFIKVGYKVSSPLAVLGNDEGGRIGKSLRTFLMMCPTGENAVDEWILAFPAPRELDAELRWFRPFVESVAVELMGVALVGVAMRAYMGALLSILDMVSDVYVIRQYFEEGRENLAVLLIALVGLNTLFQMLICWVQARGLREDRWKHLLLNWLYVLTFVKPGVDAFRVGSGAERLPGSAVDSINEMTWTKNAEMFCEAIPGFVVQSLAYITSKNKTTSAVVSLLISAVSASMTSTVSSYDQDTNLDYRKRHPHVLGMIPDDGRTLAFAVMLSLGTLQIIGKGISVALLAITNTTWLALYMISDMFILLLYKLARRDFLTWHPLPMSVSVIFSIFMRLLTKTIADFSGSMQARNPLVLGGAYYTYNLLQNQASVLFAVYLYNEYFKVVGDEAMKLSPMTTWTFSISLVSLWTLLYIYFIFRICVPKFRPTFWSIKTGNQDTQSSFLNSEDDYVRMTIFGKIRVHRRPIEAEIKEFTFANWARWVDEKPDWFTPAMIATVPDEFVPREHLTRMGVGRERRGSAAQSVGMSVRRMSEQLTSQ